ncbi:MAG TPA: hypothetical protein PKZ19_12820, partial [Zoogloea sp.]|nr:hypothetical protein [Zoogloea sp.]
MLELSFLRTQAEEAERRLAKRHIDARAALEHARQLDEARRAAQLAVDDRQAEINTLSRSIGELMKAGRKAEAEDAKARSTALKEGMDELRSALEAAERALTDHLLTLPNAPADRVPAGRTPEDNVVVVQEGAIPDLGPGAKPHWELGEEYGIL